MAREHNRLIEKACVAMRKLGIDEETVKPVLRKLLKEFDNNWKCIEEENYRDLINAIFDTTGQQCHKTDEEPNAPRSSIAEVDAVGSWEKREIISRDRETKIKTQVFFASIDQRSKRASGESACAALAAVFADWLQNNDDLLPIKSEFDNLIIKGSLEWRKLWKNRIYKKSFPDGHFDLETILQENICSISVLPEKSLIGFFHPDEMEEEIFKVLKGTESFDKIWDTISRECKPQVYIISWNDHFFVLKVSSEAYYIIDSLGERLYEGCNQAYIIKFDQDTKILKLPDTKQTSRDKIADESSLEEEVICGGKESCKEYIKRFLAAIPIRALRADAKKRRTTSIHVHQRLQIEFNFTKLQLPAALELSSSSDNSSIEEKPPLTIKRNSKRRGSSGVGPSNSQSAGAKKNKWYDRQTC